jgi:hypothetical protein
VFVEPFDPVLRVAPFFLALLSAVLSFGREFVYQWIAPVTPPTHPVECGANFSARYARELGLDPERAYDFVVSDLGIRSLRIPVYWDEVQPQPGTLRWREVDWQMHRSAAAGARVVLCVGHKVPRYPEYFAPPWAASMPERQFAAALMDFVAAVVVRYRGHAALEAWQVENEAFAGFLGWRFGAGCRDVSRWLPEEIRLVRALDPAHPIVLSYADAPWVGKQLSRTLRLDSDILAVSTYRQVYWRAPFYTGFLAPGELGVLSPLSLSYQRWATNRTGRRLWISELQAEPWPIGPGGLPAATDEELARTMSREQLADTWDMAARSGVDRAYIWGIEWLLFRTARGRDADILELVRDLARCPQGVTRPCAKAVP